MKKQIQKIICGLVICSLFAACTDLDQRVYSVVPDSQFWSTPEEIAAGVAPGYQALTAIPALGGNVNLINEVSSDELIFPTRGGDWFDGGEWQQLWLHTWLPTHPQINGAWADIFNGIGRVNFTLSTIDNLETPPAGVESTIAELKVLRALYYFWAMDLYGNVPLVTDFQTNPNDVANSSRKDIFDFIEKEVKDNIDLLDDAVDGSTYGRVNKWTAFALLAKLYLNAEVYTGTARWQDCIDATDSIINSGNYSLNPNYFDNFSPTNGPASTENIFVVPFDKVNIKGNGSQTFLHYQNNVNFGLTVSPNNGASAGPEFYKHTVDTNAVYTVNGDEVTKTYLDQRSGQWLTGQQYSLPFPYPPDKNILVKADPSLKLKDAGTGLDLFLQPDFNTISSSAGSFRLVGARSIKYYPERGTGGGEMSNDVVVFRYADILLMKAECEMRAASPNQGEALGLVNQIRERAYGNADHDWATPHFTLDSILSERGRELACEGWRRQDLIRYEVASGNHYFTAGRSPGKQADPDQHTFLFPIPANQRLANPKLEQNPGYEP